MRFVSGQTLLIDADDTLWENNIYFERAIASFISFLDHEEHSREEVREKLNEVERETVRMHGYGMSSFRHSLLTCYERLSCEPLTAENREQVANFANSIAAQEIELLPGVEETLQELCSRHRLILMTKGNEAEQADKLSRSGVAACFSAVEVPREKDTHAYSSVVRRHGLSPDSAWMIGNSPKSDINPALAVGLNAIFIKHPHTWVLEHDQVAEAKEGRRLLELARFAELGRHF
ncbi:MAG: HAD family hydrolase [Acidobacteria bacterium]|nr:HAD family hydrolase [Acidobacteriota bacterium]